MATINFDQLWYQEDNSFAEIIPQLTLKQPTKQRKTNAFKDWAEMLGDQIGEFKINTKRKMIEDMAGESVMPVLPTFIGAPEAFVLQEIYAHLDMEGA